MAGAEDACDPERLLALVRGGDPAALERITRCYGDRLLAAGRKHCRSAEEARDAVQDAWLTAATHLPEFRAEGSLSGWLVSIVASACGRLSRGRKNDASLHDGEDALTPSAAETPEAETARRELGAALDAALLELAPEDRMILLLAEVEELTGPEIAARTGLSPGAVRARLTRLRARVRGSLAPFLDDGGAA